MTEEAILNNYEAIFIIKPTLDEAGCEKTQKAVAEAITNLGGKVQKEDPWGKREISHHVKKFKEGIYHRVEFAAPAEAINKLNSTYQLNTDILRVLITKRS